MATPNEIPFEIFSSRTTWHQLHNPTVQQAVKIKLCELFKVDPDEYTLELELDVQLPRTMDAGIVTANEPL